MLLEPVGSTLIGLAKFCSVGWLHSFGFYNSAIAIESIISLSYVECLPRSSTEFGKKNTFHFY